MKTKINKFENDWTDIKNKCRTTVSKHYTETEPSDSFKQALLLSEHSPIRLWKVNWTWDGLKSWVATHFSRHKWECFISTRRSDRIGFDRGVLSQDELVTCDGEANAQHLIDTSRKRLCHKASDETRESWERLLELVNYHEPEVAYVCVPNCVYRCGCPEFEQCGLWAKLSKDMTATELSDIRTRYDKYHEYKRGE